MYLKLINEKENLKKYILQEDEKYNKLKNKTDDLRTQRTINIILKNNLINERDNLKSLIKSYKLQKLIEKIKSERERKQFEKISIIKYLLIKNNNDREIEKYKIETEKLIDVAKEKIKLLQLEKNNLKFNDDDNYRKSLDEFKEENKKIIKKKLNIISKNRHKLNKAREISEKKIKKYETIINEEISYRKNILRNYTYVNLTFHNSLINQCNNIKKISF